MSLKRIVPAVTALLLTLGACTPEGVCYHRFLRMDPNGWTRTDTLVFADTLWFSAEAVPARLLLETIIRHDGRYPYENLHLKAFITAGTQPAPGDSLHDGPASLRTAQLFSLTLVDAGHRWNGEGWGSLFTKCSVPHTLSLSQALFAPGTRSYYHQPDTSRLNLPLTVRLVSAMADDRLPGIESVGLRIKAE